MEYRDFCYWLKGAIDFSETDPALQHCVSASFLTIVKNRLINDVIGGDTGFYLINQPQGSGFAQTSVSGQNKVSVAPLVEPVTSESVAAEVVPARTPPSSMNSAELDDFVRNEEAKSLAGNSVALGQHVEPEPNKVARRGRPKGSKNKNRSSGPVIVDHNQEPKSETLIPTFADVSADRVATNSITGVSGASW